MAVKFPLKMADGTMVRTLEDLREHFDLTTVLSYYDNGRLVKWLENGYYDEEAGKVAALDVASADFAKELCAILGVDFSESEAGQVDLDGIAKRNERLEHLKQFTADDAILAAVDRVAFSQEELEYLLNRGVTEIYLHGDQFIMPEGFEDVPYHCINSPVVRFAKLERLEKDAVQGDTKAQLELAHQYEARNDIDAAIGWYTKAISQGEIEALTALAKFDDKLASAGKGPEVVKWYTDAAEKGSVQAQMKLASFYLDGWDCVECDEDTAMEWCEKAAAQGHMEAFAALIRYQMIDDECLDIDTAIEWYKKALDAGYTETMGLLGDHEMFLKWYLLATEEDDAEAQVKLGDCYMKGICVEEDEDEALKWYKAAAEQEYIPAIIKVGDYYQEQYDSDEAKEWYERAADQGDAEAQTKLGRVYEEDCDEEDEGDIVEWYQLAAEQGYAGGQTELGRCYNIGFGVEEDEEEAIKWFRKAAEQNYAEGLYALGECYEKGFGVEQDYEKAMEWYKKAAEQGHGVAQAMMGAYYSGLDSDCRIGKYSVEQGYKEALKWYKMAAEQGDGKAQEIFDFLDNYRKATELNDTEAQAKVAYSYLQGIWSFNGRKYGDDRDEALKWYKIAADNGDAAAQTALQECERAGKLYQKAKQQSDLQTQIDLACCYLYGKGVKKDVNEAAKWYRKPAELGNASAQFGLGKCYMDDDYYNEEEYDDEDFSSEEEGVKWYRLAAEQGYIEAQVELGQYYSQRGNIYDWAYGEAARWYRIAAEQGDCTAQIEVAFLHQCGDGVEKDEVEAVKWYKMAAKQGTSEAQVKLAECYEKGWGVEQDYEEAIKWYKLAAEQGDAEAQYNLGTCFDFGKGVEEDKERAIMWYKKAAEQGHSYAQCTLGERYAATCYDDMGYNEAIKWYKLAVESGDTTVEKELTQLRRRYDLKKLLHSQLI